jgi:hypothetical protein
VINSFFCCFLFTILQRVICKVVSFEATGKWGPAQHDECDRFMCTSSNKTWIPNYPSVKFGPENGCEMLLSKGITTVYFFGDSYMRQIYAGLLITLSGDYKYGSIANATMNPHCAYHQQFNERRCQQWQLNHHGLVCGGKILLDPILLSFDNLNWCNKQNGTVCLWSVGNYNIKGHGGKNNATIHQTHFERIGNCDAVRNHQRPPFHVIRNSSCTMFWVSTHYRLRQIYWDESVELVRDYNERMRSFFDSQTCGEFNYIDVYNMTAALATQYNSEAVQI